MIKLSEIATTPPDGWTKSETREKTKAMTKKIGELQELLYAED